MDEITIRRATVDDLDTLVDGNCRMAKETEDKTLDPETVRHGLKAVIEDTSKGRHWVACAGEKIVGQLLITYEWSDWRNGTMWWIQSVYVDEDWRRKGVFRALYRYVHDAARLEEGCRGLRLYVELENTRAQATYEAMGMVDAGYRIMEDDFTTD